MSGFFGVASKENCVPVSYTHLDLAGYNRGTFYLYYKDVYDILASIEAELLQASEQILETARESELSGLKNHMSMIMELARKYSAYVSVSVSYTHLLCMANTPAIASLTVRVELHRAGMNKRISS